MDAKLFERSFKDQVNRCWELLGKKNQGYADPEETEDYFHNFRLGAQLTQRDPVQTLQGFLAKHTVKLNDMMTSGKYYPPAVWQEVITDSLNYLFILNALLADGENASRAPDDLPIDPYPAFRPNKK